jgi:hypothetical protein
MIEDPFLIGMFYGFNFGAILILWLAVWARDGRW